MTALHQDAPPAYTVDLDGTVRINAAGAALRAQHAVVDAQFRELARGWARAEVAALFVRHPSVLAFDLDLSLNWEYNDSGGCYQSGWCTVGNVCLDPASPQIDEFLKDGEPDAEEAAGVLECELHLLRHDLAMVILGDDDCDERRETYRRGEMLALLGLHSSESPPSSAVVAEPSK